MFNKTKSKHLFILENIFEKYYSGKDQTLPIHSAGHIMLLHRPSLSPAGKTFEFFFFFFPPEKGKIKYLTAALVLWLVRQAHLVKLSIITGG